MVTTNHNLVCRQAKGFYYNYITDDGKDEIPVELIEHMNSCPGCKLEIDELRTQLAGTRRNTDLRAYRDALTIENLELQYNYINEPLSCNEVKAFLPILADTTLSVRVPTPITAHIDNCQLCACDLDTISSFGLSHAQLCFLAQFYADSKAADSLQKLNESLVDTRSKAEIKEFQDGIYAILEREESNVVTIFKADRSVQADAYLPIAVEVLDKDKTTFVNSNKTISRFKPVFSKIAAVAAVFVVGFFVSQMSVLQAVDLNHIYKALAEAKNVHVVQYYTESSQLTDETWTSKLLNVRLFKTSAGYTLWDINNKEIKTNEVATDSINNKKFDDQSIEKINSSMTTVWDLLPQTTTADLPEDAVWEKVKNENTVFGLSNIDAYDLSWTQETVSGGLSHYKWRIFVDTKTHLPQKLEFWDKYVLTIIKEIDYPTNSQFQQIIEQAGF